MKMKPNLKKRTWLLALIQFIAATSMVAQDYQISGRVTDATTGEPLSFVAVVEKATRKSAVTDDNGVYKLSVAGVNSVVVFQLMGYAQTAAIVAGPVLDIALQADIRALDEVVVVAYGTAKKSSYTGSATSVKKENIEKLTPTTVTESLQGMSAGVTVLNNVGSPGSDPTIMIRGIGSMGASTSPLYVVDGVPYTGNLNSIAASDIENMSILKDAVASSLYGSRAANGVIMITTKRGSQEKPTVNFRATWGTSDIATKYPKKGTPAEHFEYWWEGLYNDQIYVYGADDATARQYATDHLMDELINPQIGSSGQTVYPNPYNMNNPIATTGKLDPNAKLVWNESDYDWYGAVFSPKLRQEYSLDVSGMANGGNTRYFVSGSYIDDKGYAISQDFTRYTIRANVSTKVAKIVELGGNLSYARTDGNISSGMVRVIRTMPAYASPWLRNNDNTDWVYSEATGDRMLDYGKIRKGWYGWNPFSESGDYNDNPNGYGFRNSAADIISGRAFIDLNFFEGFNFRSNFSLDRSINMWMYYDSAIHGAEQTAPYGVAVKPNGGWAGRYADGSTAYTWNNLLTYATTIADDHNISVLLGHELYHRFIESQGGDGSGIPFGYRYEIQSATRDYYADSYTDEYSMLSFLTRLEYNYKNKYYVSGSYRLDASSRFHPDNRYGNFFSAGASWRISEEGFLEDAKWIENLALKASWGTTGNDQINTYYAYQGTYTSYNLYSNAGLRLNALPNPNLLWEKNQQFNTGVEFRLFGWLLGSAEYFVRNAKDLLYYKDLPLSSQGGNATGYNTNLGDVRNSGIELTVGATVFNTNKFRWNVDANFTYLKNEITYLPEEGYTFTQWGWATMRMEEGKSLYELYAPSWAGVDPATGDVQYWKKVFDANGKVIDRVKTFDYSEVNNDDQRDYKGSTIPKYFGSVTNAFTYAGFDFSFMLYYSLGSYMADYDYNESSNLRETFAVYPELMNDRWQKPGDVAKLARFRTVNTADTRRYSDFQIFKNDYLRLRNIALGYTLPKPWLQKLGLNSVRIFVSADNLLTFGSAVQRGSDPEIDIAGINQNGANGGYSNTRKTFTGGIQLSF